MITNDEIIAAGLDPEFLLLEYEQALKSTNSIGQAFKSIENAALFDRDESPFTFGELHEWAKANSKTTLEPVRTDILFPCPLCGYDAYYDEMPIQKLRRIFCINREHCGLEIESSSPFVSKDELVARWNRRAKINWDLLNQK